MPLVGAALMPHGSQALEELHDPLYERFRKTHDGLVFAARGLARVPAGTAVVLTPHGIRAENMVTVSISETMRGVLSEGKEILDETFEVDRALAAAIAEQAERCGLSTAKIAAGASSGPHSQLPMDWGAQVPLHFLRQTVAGLKTVVMTPSRAWALTQLFELGQALRDTLDAWPKPVWLIASADMAHAHDAAGPYGFHPAAAAFDQWFQEVVQRQDWDALLNVNMDWVSDAKPDALWQMVILAGALTTNFSSHVIGYDCPTYFGMMNALFTRRTA